MKCSRLALWLLAFLLLIGQQGSLLHHLGHELDEVTQLVAVADAASANGTTPSSESDGHAGNCSLCVGFAASGASVPGDLRFDLPATQAGFARPVGESGPLSAVAPAATPIRGPPPAFSTIV